MIRTIGLAAALIFTVAPASAHTTEPPADAVFPRGLPYAIGEGECATYRCVWDARHQGNGEGQSLLITRYGKSFLAKPITHRRAHRLHVAYCARPKVNCAYAD